MITFIKLGGSLITDKRESQTFHAEVMSRTAHEIVAAKQADPGLELLIGHGSGSFGHVAASKHGTAEGVHTPEQWVGFAEVATIARRLNSLVIETLFEAGLPIFAVQPSASARCAGGTILEMDHMPIAMAIDHHLIPVVYGDVAFDSSRGATIISTEAVFFYLATRIRPSRIFLLGEVEGVYDGDGAIIPHITPGNLESIAGALGGSHGTDVTGGMASKVRGMVELVKSTAEANAPPLEIRIFGGTTSGQLEAALTGRVTPGTLISAE